MNNNAKLMSIVFDLGEPLFTREYPSDIVQFQTFTTVQTNTPIWTPGANNSIYLTALQISSLAPVVVEINRENNSPFMSIAITDTLATYGISFSSPIKFNPDEIISITTSAASTVSITLLGYEL
ncbi:MAG: hypothetical protein M0Q14_08445 [Tissierellaceae bacterium]|nr:hypothetical protein [Tissierellaceae bacterium]